MDLLREKQRAGGAHRAMGGSPDNSGQNAAALMQAQLSKEQLDWAKKIYADTAPDRKDATTRANTVSDAQLAASNQQMEIASQANSDYQSTYRPLEKQVVGEATGYDTPERRAAESASAVSSVETNLATQRGATLREQERAGVNPASGKVAALQGSMDLNAAKLKAGAGNMASKGVEALGAAKKADAVNLGRGIASSQASNVALGMQQGSSSVQNSNAALTAANNGTLGVQQGFAGAQSGLASAGGTFGNIASQQQAATNSKNSNIAAGVGTAISAYAAYAAIAAA